MTILKKISDVNNFDVGGGAASALAGSQASGMIGMVLNLSLGKDYGLEDEAYKAKAKRAEELSEILLAGAEEDEQAFLKIRNAYKLPKSSELEKNIRKNALQYGFVSAANTPLCNAQWCKECYDLGKDLVGKSNPNAETDLLIAIQLAEVGLKGCISNVEANISMIKDQSIVDGFEEALEKLK